MNCGSVVIVVIIARKGLVVVVVVVMIPACSKMEIFFPPVARGRDEYDIR